MSDSEIPGNIFAQQSEDHEENVYFLLEYIYPKYTREEWVKWANRKKLTADEAIPLMNGLDPISWMEYIENGKGDLFSELIQSIKRCLIIAKAEGFQIGTPAEWLVWGRNHDLNKPILKSNEWLKEPDTCMFYLFETAVNAVSKSSNALKPNQSDKQEINKSKINNIPGTIPKIAICRLAVEVACKIEQETGMRATAREVLEKLQYWAENGQEYSEVLHRRPDGVRGMDVYWITCKLGKKKYSLAACEKTLERWNKSRQ